MSSRKIIKADRINVERVSQGVLPKANHRPARQGRGDIDVQVRRRGELIEALEVSCSCGRSSVLDCMYDSSVVAANAVAAATH